MYLSIISTELCDFSMQTLALYMHPVNLDRACTAGGGLRVMFSYES
jgi:hypothetical protein